MRRIFWSGVGAFAGGFFNGAICQFLGAAYPWSILSGAASGFIIGLTVFACYPVFSDRGEK
jgi:dipeptide/tripeptide permease